ncbi:MAG: phosphatase, partial [Planctomycetota bacterium]|nr:phosphatase [Planctomycetota bacterium]
MSALGVACLTVGFARGGWWLLDAWIGFNFLLVGLAHAVGFQRLLGKRRDGTLPVWSWLLFLPYHLVIRLIWHIARLTVNEPAYNQARDDLFVGRRLLGGELDAVISAVDNYVDLTSEFTEPAKIRALPSYLCCPILDGGAPSPEQLSVWLAALRPGRTYVHCARGYGRTGLFAVAILLSHGTVTAIDEGLAFLKRSRPRVRLNR